MATALKVGKKVLVTVAVVSNLVRPLLIGAAGSAFR